MNFCPHCRSKQNSSFKDSTWGCGVRFDDPRYRTKACYKRELNAANERIKRLEEAGNRIARWCVYEEEIEEWNAVKENKP